MPGFTSKSKFLIGLLALLLSGNKVLSQYKPESLDEPFPTLESKPGFLFPDGPLSSKIFGFGISLVSKTDVACPQTATGSIQVQAQGGVLPYTYSIDTGKTFVSSPNFYSLKSGNYTFYARDGSGNITGPLVVNILEPSGSPFLISVTGTNITCKGAKNGTATVKGTGGNGQFTYTWDTQPVQTTATINGLAPGTYTAILYQGITGAFWTFSGNTGIEADSSTYLNLGNISLLNPEGYQGAILDESGGFYQDIYFPVAGTYKINFKAAHRPGFASHSFVLQIDGQQIGNFLTSPPSAFNNYSSSSFSVSPGYHRIEFQGSNYGVSAQSIIDSIYFTSSTSSTTPLGYNLGFEYPKITTTGANAYILDPPVNPCFLTQSITITEPATILKDSILKIAQISCFGKKNGAISLVASGGTPPYAFSIDNGKTFQSASVFNNLDTGYYSLVVKDSSHCKTTPMKARITQPPYLDAQVDTLIGITCNNPNGSIRIKAQGGTAPYSYSKNNGISYQSSNTFSGLATGNYTLMVKDSMGCSLVIPNIQVPVQNGNAITKIRIGTLQNTYCPGVLVGFLIYNNPGNLLNYSWFVNGIKQVGGDSSTFYSSNFKNGDQVYLRYGTACSAVNYSDTLSLSFPVKPLLSLKANQNQPCAGNLIELDAITSPAVSGGNYRWFVNGLQVNADSSIFRSTDLKSGDRVNCLFTPGSITCFPFIKSDTLVITQSSLAQPSIQISSNAQSVCTGTPIVFKAVFTQGGSNPHFQWYKNGNPDGTNDSTYSSSNFQSGDKINCLFTSSLSCTNPISSNTLIPTINPLPSVSFLSDLELISGKSLVLNPQVSGSINHYQWTPATGLSNPNIENPVASPSLTTTYQLTVTTEPGCSDMASIKITVIPAALEIPNAFSPNGDGVNDYWMIPQITGNSEVTVDIYNRYGQSLFHSDGYTKPWDGTYNGKSLPFGTYYYLINLNNGTKPLSGYLTLIR